MNRLQRATILALLVQSLREHQSWAGETHVQKATYLLEHAAGVPLDYEFVLYKHGPFSFDLRDELSEFSGDGLLVIEPQKYPYGPRLRVTDLGERNVDARGHTADLYRAAISRVVSFVGSRGVGVLERLTTALLLHIESPDTSDVEIADRLVKLKPHVGRFDALSAVRELLQALPSLQGSDLTPIEPESQSDVSLPQTAI